MSSKKGALARCLLLVMEAIIDMLYFYEAGLSCSLFSPSSFFGFQIYCLGSVLE